MPACPDWDADDLLWHLGGVQHFWANVMRIRPSPPEDYERPERPADRDGLASFFRRPRPTCGPGCRQQTTARRPGRGTTATRPSRSSVPARPRRRSSTVSTPNRRPATPPTSRRTWRPTAVSEVLDWCLGHTPAWATFTPDEEVVRFESTDSGASRTSCSAGIRAPTPTAAQRSTRTVCTCWPGRASTDATVRGRGADLDTWLWHRGDDSALTMQGDTGALARVLAVLGEPVD